MPLIGFLLFALVLVLDIEICTLSKVNAAEFWMVILDGSPDGFKNTALVFRVVGFQPEVEAPWLLLSGTGLGDGQFC